MEVLDFHLSSNERRWIGHLKYPDTEPNIYDGLNPLEQLQIMLQRVDDGFDRTSIFRGNGTQHRRNDPCAYCGWSADTWDHIEPRVRIGHRTKKKNKRGKTRTVKHGSNGPSNVVRACQECNQRKGSLSLLHFLVWKDCRVHIAYRNHRAKLCYLLTKLMQNKLALAESGQS